MIDSMYLFHSGRSVYEEVLIGWSRPPLNGRKLNTDGAVKRSSGCANSRGVLRTSDGKLVVGFMVNLGNCSVLMVELWSVLYGLRMSLQQDIRRIELEVDNKVVIDMILNISQLPYNCNRDWIMRSKNIYRESTMYFDHMVNGVQRCS
ncbi:conserved hypothetical protein [Ricinus communis]|uniref:RNase H type-1 domain-containing protein n=1 Tax=Ricinus communis TaxID=3988 RepID=B9SAK1_RICCO|nr:conserved hypothetical protein [Ricinus communis]